MKILKVIQIISLLFVVVIMSCRNDTNDKSMNLSGKTFFVNNDDFSETEIMYSNKIFEETSSDSIYIERPTVVKYNPFDGKIYVVDIQANDIKTYTHDFKFLDVHGRKGQGPGEFFQPFNICFGKNGEIYISEHFNSRIQVFNNAFKYISSFNINFINPYNNFDVDSQGYIYLSNSKIESKSLISVCSQEGKAIEAFGEKLPYSEYPESVQRDMNWVSIRIMDDEIYCCFNHQPIVRKYGIDRELIYELNFSKLAEVEKYKKKIDKVAGGNTIPFYFDFIEVDDERLYLSINPSINPGKGEMRKLFILNKDTGKPICKKNIDLSVCSDYSWVSSFNASHPEFYYLIERISERIVQLKKY